MSIVLDSKVEQKRGGIVSMNSMDYKWHRLLCVGIVAHSLLFVSCQHKALQFEQRVHEWWEAKCSGVEKCNGSMNELVPFQWDRMYFINVNHSAHDVDVAVGFPTEYKEFSRMVIFVKNDKVVYSEQEENPVEYFVDRTVVFLGSEKNALVVMFTSSHPEFTADRLVGDNNHHYYRIRHRE